MGIHRENRVNGRHPWNNRLRAMVATFVGIVVASLAAGITMSPASAQFDDERQPGTCVLSEVVETELSQNQCDALTALYWATRGPDWTDQRGWDEPTDPCTWGGVTCAPGNGHAVVRHLVLHDNGLSGYLPEQVEGLRWLQKLQLSSNDIGGAIPSQVGLLQQLRVLDLSGNRFSKDVPGRIGDLSHLRVLDLSDNQLTGNVPERIAELDSLIQLYLDRNDCLVLQAATQRAMNTLVESSFHDHCARTTVASSCLAGNGRLDIHIANESVVPQTYSVVVGALAPRERTVPAGESSRVSVTGRDDGDIEVTVLHRGIQLHAGQVEVDCDPDFAAWGAGRCVRGHGRLDVTVTNDSNADERIWVAADDLPIRSVVVPASGQQTVTIAVLAGDRSVLVTTASRTLGSFVTRVICT